MMKYLIQKEILNFIRNPFLPRLAIAMPVVIILILPLVVTMDVKNVKVCIVDCDNSTSSSRLANLIAASGYFRSGGKAFSYEEGLKLVEKGTADVVLEIPSGFERNLMEGKGADALIAANATDAAKGGIGGGYLTAIISDFAVRTLQKSTGFKPQAQTISQLNMYNREMNYRTFMLPALMGMIVIIISCVFPALSIVGEKESGSLEQINVTPVKRWQFILAKLIPFWILGIVVLSITFLLARLVYGFRPAGSLATIYLASILMTATMSALGLIISNVSNNFQQAFYMFFFIMIIFIMMSGLYTPTSSMPDWARYFSCALPPRYFMEIMRGAYLKGSGFAHLWKQFAMLSVFAISFSGAAIASYRKRS
jgi:ABC-2 type transport system permease protein